MAKSRRAKSELVYPWESSGFLRGRGRAVRYGVTGLAMTLVAGALWARESDARARRVTRASLVLAAAATDRYRAAHELRCPEDEAVLVREGLLQTLPVDGWGVSLELECPARNLDVAFLWWSAGPDGEHGGLDAIHN